MHARQKHHSKVKLVQFLISFSFLATMILSVGFAAEGNEIDIDFDIITGSGIDDYYVGDYFYYNITLTNSGDTVINATLLIQVFNSTGGLMPEEKECSIFLAPNQTTFVIQNRTSIRVENEFTIYPMDTPGTYSIVVSSETPITYFYYYEDGAFRYRSNYIRYSFDVMESYLKDQNERWNEFLEKNENYMEAVEEYIQVSRKESAESNNISYISMFIAVSSAALSTVALLWDMDEDKKRQRPWFYKVTMFLIVAICVLLIWMFAIIL